MIQKIVFKGNWNGVSILFVYVPYEHSVNEKLRREDIFKPTIENESLHQFSTDSGVRIINVATSKTLVV
jgi:hypothetical protein